MGDLLTLPLGERDASRRRTVEGAANGEGRKVGDGGPIQGFIDSYIGGRRSRGEISRLTAANLRSGLESFAFTFGKRPVAQLGPSHIDAWLEQMERDRLKPSTRSTYLSTMRAFVRWLIRQKVIKRDPLVDVKTIRKPDTMPVVFDPDEWDALFSVLPDERAVVIVLLTLQAGLRRAEVATLMIADIGPGYRYAKVTGKFSKERVVAFAEELRDAIAQYVAVRGSFGGPLIVKYDRPSGMRPDSIGKLFTKWCWEAGIKDAPGDGKSMHAGRRTCATTMAEEGKPLSHIAAHLGHKGLQSLPAYVRLACPPSSVEGRRFRGGRVLPMRQSGGGVA